VLREIGTVVSFNSDYLLLSSSIFFLCVSDIFYQLGHAIMAQNPRSRIMQAIENPSHSPLTPMLALNAKIRAKDIPKTQ